MDDTLHLFMLPGLIMHQLVRGMFARLEYVRLAVVSRVLTLLVSRAPLSQRDWGPPNINNDSHGRDRPNNLTAETFQRRVFSAFTVSETVSVNCLQLINSGRDVQQEAIHQDKLFMFLPI